MGQLQNCCTYREKTDPNTIVHGRMASIGSVASSPLKTDRFVELCRSKLLEDSMETTHTEINITNK